VADDSDRPLSGRGVLYGTHLEWDRFLCRLGSDGTAPRSGFVARNFILDEGVWPERADSYHTSSAVADHGDYASWKARHGAYLKESVQRVHWEEPLDPHDGDVCPETFRFPDRHTPFDSTDRNLHLIRLERAETVADLIKVAPSRLLSVANEALTNPTGARADLEDLLIKWFEAKDGRPVYCGFFADLEEDLAADLWADALRDRLGLAHFDPGEIGKPIDILVFKYPVSQVSRLAGAASHTRPLVPPTVLDGDFSEAFCPAPTGGLTGHVVNLDWNDLEERRLRNAALRREVLHPKTRLLAKHLFRVGRIEKPVDFENLPLARAAHLEQVRTASGRADYAMGTDKDLP
jgi:hypothetical protein